MKITLEETPITSPWETIIAFDDIRTPAIPADFLPRWGGAFVREISACAQTPEAFGVILGFCTLAACLQKRFEVCPFGDSYTEPLNIWGACAMPPGSRKTFVVEQLNHPLESWEREQAALLKSEIEESAATRLVVEKRIERLQVEAAKENDPIKRQVFIREICSLKEEIPEQVRAPRLYTNDCTPERFQSLLVENHERMAVLSDEGGIFEIMSGLYSDGRANLDVFLKSHVGSPVRVDRGSRDAHLSNPLSTFGLAVQPQIIEELAQGSKRRFRGTGCLARFLYCVPESNIGHRDLSRRQTISEETRERYRCGVRNLLSIPPVMVEGIERPRVLRLDREALKSWVAFQQALEKRQSETGDLAGIADWTAKLPGEALRLAGISHIVENGSESELICRQTIERTLDLADLLILHALTAFSIMGADQSTVDAKYVAKWLRARGATYIRQNDIYRGCHGRIPKMDRLQKALSALIDRHVISEPIIEATGGRPSTYFFVNPAFFEDK